MSSIVDVLMPVSIMGSCGASVYFFTKCITDYKLKKSMIEKGYVNDESQSIFKKQVAENRHTPLKWGLLSLTSGISFILMEYLDVRPDSPMPFGIFAASLSVGFLTYYFIIRKDLKS